MGMFSVPLRVAALNGAASVDNGNSETVMATVDTGAFYSVLPDSLLRALGAEPVENLIFELTSGEFVEYPTGFVALETQGRFSVGRVVFGPEGRFLLGAMSLQDMRLNVDPSAEQLTPKGPLWF